MNFEVVGQIANIETIAVGHGIRELQNLKRLFGDAHWRKLKGESSKVKLESNFQVVMSVWPRYIGTKPTESGGEN